MAMGRTYGHLFNFRTSLWLLVHRQPLEGATGISLDLNISAVFKDIAALFSAFGRACSVS